MIILPDENKKAKAPAEPRFTKAQLVNSRRYQDRRDLLQVTLKDNETYSHSDIEKIIGAFMESRVT